ncbi:MAG: glutamate--tRNA ligase [bacterium]|nr:glutamate--tRNA ligase [bacterium]
MVRVRFAPSPTGNLHIGSLRTALFNWIFAKHNKGSYILRIEDTDSLRSKKEYEENILEGLEWLGLHMDEGPEINSKYGPYRQSERFNTHIYSEYVEKLINSGCAYYCFCTDEELELERDAAQKKNITYIYSRKCLNQSREEVKKKLESKKSYTVKFKVPQSGTLSFIDLIRSEIKFDLSLISDFVLLKSDKTPSYNFAVVVDDMLMNITHVIRGEDHISNTPKQICLYNAFKVKTPHFAHLPMILGPDRSKLSKRHGATSVNEYREKGYLKETLLNYLVLLGWSAPDNHEILSINEIIKLFSLDRISRSGAIFDITKLNWMNGQYIRKMDAATLADNIKPFIAKDFTDKISAYPAEKLERIIYSFHEKLVLLTDINNLLPVYIYSMEDYKIMISQFDFSSEEKDIICSFRNELSMVDMQDLSAAKLNNILKNIQTSKGGGKGRVLKPVRFACSAEKTGPDLIEFLLITGKETLLERLNYCIDNTLT